MLNNKLLYKLCEAPKNDSCDASSHSGPAISCHLIKPGTSKHGTWAWHGMTNLLHEINHVQRPENPMFKRTKWLKSEPQVDALPSSRPWTWMPTVKTPGTVIQGHPGSRVMVPSGKPGKLTVCYWKWLLKSLFFPWKMVIFHSYVNVYQAG